jgi:hypothetical protein
VNVAPPGDTFAVSADTTSAFERASCPGATPAPAHPNAARTNAITSRDLPLPFLLLRIVMESASK